MGIYSIIFGIVSQRYENRIDIIENRSNAIFAQLATFADKRVLSRIPKVQNMSCPYKPDFMNPWTIILSLLPYKNKEYLKITLADITNKNGNYDKKKYEEFLRENFRYPDMVIMLKETVEDWKDKLGQREEKSNDIVDLSNAYLVAANLIDANLENVYMEGANLEYALLNGAKLVKAKLGGASLEHVR